MPKAATPSITVWGHRAQRLDPQAQSNGGKFLAELVQRLHQFPGGQHDIDHQAGFGFKSLCQSARLGEQAIERDGEPPAVGQDGTACIGECGFAGAGALEQRDAQLGFQVGDGIADHRGSAAQLAGSTGEAAGLHDRQKHGDLIQSGGLWVHLFNFLERLDRNYPSFQNRASRLSQP
jgi:hypothetical protein